MSEFRTLTEEEYEEALSRMNNASERSDVEERHQDADEILCDVLEKCGYQELVKVFDNMKKWYS